MDNSTPGNNVVFDENGIPVNRYGAPVSSDSIKSKLMSAASNMYKPVKDENGYYKPGEYELIGKTVAEVAADRAWQRAAEGDLQAYNQVLDRTIGKPKQTIEQTGKVELSLQSWIDEKLASNPNLLQVHMSEPAFYEDVKDLPQVEIPIDAEVVQFSIPKIDREGLAGF